MNYAQSINDYLDLGYPLLSVFDGDQVSGIWTMTIEDSAFGDQGTVNDVSLLITYDSPVDGSSDNCGVVSLTSKDVVANFDCNSDFQQVIYRTWTAKDAAGLSASCVQMINITRTDLSQLTFPLNYDDLAQNHPMLECDEDYPLDNFGNPHPDYTGWPDGYNEVCGTVEVFYADDVYVLACGKKILRTWTVIDDCTGEIVKHIQIIRITDKTAPTFCPPEAIIARTKAYICEADIEVPAIHCLKDVCDAFPRWWVTTDAGVLFGDKNLNGFVDANETWFIMGATIGDYKLCYHAIDNCGNAAKPYCVRVTVIDGVPPIPVCEQFKQVSLTAYGHAKVKAEDYDSGSFDNCADPVYFKVLRVNADFKYDGGCKDLNFDHPVEVAANTAWFDDEVYFCCEDIGKEVMVTLRVFDVPVPAGPVKPSDMEQGGRYYGHFNDCWNMTLIECKIPPVLSCPTIDVTCEESLDPNINPKLWPGVVALCDVELSYDPLLDQKSGLCDGKLVRKWTAVGCGKTTTCTQTINIWNVNPFDPSTIVFPADPAIAHCDEDFNDAGVPEWKENPCNIVTAEVIKEDTFKFVDGACYKILREWAVIDWCVYVPNTGAEFNIDKITSGRKLASPIVVDGYYRYTQVLKIEDRIPPQITVVDQCIPTTD